MILDISLSAYIRTIWATGLGNEGEGMVAVWIVKERNSTAASNSSGCEQSRLCSFSVTSQCSLLQSFPFPSLHKLKAWNKLRKRGRIVKRATAAYEIERLSVWDFHGQYTGKGWWRWVKLHSKLHNGSYRGQHKRLSLVEFRQPWCWMVTNCRFRGIVLLAWYMHFLCLRFIYFYYNLLLSSLLCVV